MAHHLPVVATDVGDVADLLDHGRCGALVPPDDADLLAHAIWRLFADPARAQTTTRCARSRYEEQYTIEVMRRQVEKAYRLAYAQRRR
ncbi:MAG: glycosyltransferase [Pseudonocardiaceae bacterium]